MLSSNGKVKLVVVFVAYVRSVADPGIQNFTVHAEGRGSGHVIRARPASLRTVRVEAPKSFLDADMSCSQTKHNFDVFGEKIKKDLKVKERA